ncbi:MAG: cytochrome C oxidase subunit IV family protein [Planctomycetales bacterium]|nr:cytochrome C oxidase subunit IV family protein [Planctomycetales bacterium]
MSDNHDHDHESHGGNALYLTVFGFLVVLTAASFALGNATSIKEANPGVVWAGMMAISTAKAMLVILFFMHLKWEANWKYVLTIPCMMMSVFLVCMLIPDIGRRMDNYDQPRIWAAAEVHSSHAHDGEHADEHESGGAEDH